MLTNISLTGSPFFQNLFISNPCKHPIVILKDVRFVDLKAIIDFMYRGEVNVSQDQLSALLKTAETLKVKGLAEVTEKQAKSQIDGGLSRSKKRKRKNKQAHLTGASTGTGSQRSDSEASTEDEENFPNNANTNDFSNHNQRYMAPPGAKQLMRMNYGGSTGQKQPKPIAASTSPNINSDQNIPSDIEPTSLLEQSMSTADVSCSCTLRKIKTC